MYVPNSTENTECIRAHGQVMFNTTLATTFLLMQQSVIHSITDLLVSLSRRAPLHHLSSPRTFSISRQLFQM